MTHRESFGAVGSPGSANVLTLVSTFSVSTLKPQLEEWLQVIDSPHRIEVVPCSLPHRYLIDPEHGLIRRPTGIHVVLFRLDDWNNFAAGSFCDDDIHPESRSLVERNLRITIECLEAAADRSFGLLILVLCPLSLEHYRQKGLRKYFETVEKRLSEALTCCSHYALINATTLMTEAELDFAADESSEPYTQQFFERLSRRIGQICYAAESRPWRVLVLSPGENARMHGRAWRDFIGSQWRHGRRLAVIGNYPLSRSEECYIPTHLSSLSVPQKIRQIGKKLLTSDQDVIFLGSDSECREIEENLPQILALPVFDRESDWAAILRELWCLQPIPEFWLSEMDPPKPSVPRLPGPLLLKLAANPDWPARGFRRWRSAD